MLDLQKRWHWRWWTLSLTPVDSSSWMSYFQMWYPLSSVQVVTLVKPSTRMGISIQEQTWTGTKVLVLLVEVTQSSAGITIKTDHTGLPPWSMSPGWVSFQPKSITQFRAEKPLPKSVHFTSLIKGSLGQMGQRHTAAFRYLVLREVQSNCDRSTWLCCCSAARWVCPLLPFNSILFLSFTATLKKVSLCKGAQ